MRLDIFKFKLPVFIHSICVYMYRKCVHENNTNKPTIFYICTSLKVIILSSVPLFLSKTIADDNVTKTLTQAMIQGHSDECRWERM